MGYIRHHAIIVTGFDHHVVDAHATALDYGMSVSDIAISNINDYRSFFIAPDGSNESWADSVEGDRRRDTFIAYLNTLRYDDESSPLEWVEVFYSHDDRKSGIVRHTDQPSAAVTEYK